jgi:hypothetical protein
MDNLKRMAICFDQKIERGKKQPRKSGCLNKRYLKGRFSFMTG